MQTVKVQMEKGKAHIFRELAMKTYGHSKGALSKAANAAIDLWLMRIEIPKKKMTAYDLIGTGPKSKMSSVEVQHYAKELMIQGLMKNVSNRR